MDETWRKSPSCDLYSISSLGRVRRDVASQRSNAGTVISQRMTARGYMTVMMYPKGKMLCRRVNRLVCEAFHGEAPTTLHHAAHINGNSLDNRENNLKWVLAEENEAHKVKHGTKAGGMNHGHTKLSDANVTAIRESNLSNKDVAAQFGISKSYAWQLRTGKWRRGL